MAKEEKFEVVLDKLQSIVRELEAGDISLEDSIKKFESGMAMAKSCQDRLNVAEKKIEILVKENANSVETEAFGDEE